MHQVVPHQRVLRGAAATLRFENVDQNGSLAEPAGAVTVEVLRADGSVLLVAGTATTVGTTGVRTVALTAAQTATLDVLTAKWTDDGDGSVHETTVEVAGGFFFSIKEARESDSTLADAAKYPDADILGARLEVEMECEHICAVAFVPRYRRFTVDGQGSRDLFLPDHVVRKVRSVRVYSDPTTFSSFTAGELAALAIESGRLVRRTDGGVFTEGLANIVVEYEHGHDRPFPDLKRASLLRLRSRLNLNKTGIPDRATSFQVADGGTFRLDTPDDLKTGIPEVDAAYARHSRRFKGGRGLAPASARMDLDPQRHSLFHGGRR